MKFTPAASTSTSTSPGPATGGSTSPNSRTSGPPASIARTAWVMTPPAYNLMCWYSYTYERFQCCRLRCHRIRRGRGPPAAEHSPPSERHNGVRTLFRGRDTRPTSTPSSPILRTCGPRVHRRGTRRPRCRRPRPAARPVRRISAAASETCYGADHQGTWTYGLPELLPADGPKQREALSDTKRIAVPGRNVTAVTLGLAPLIQAGLAAPAGLNAVLANGVS